MKLFTSSTLLLALATASTAQSSLRGRELEAINPYPFFATTERDDHFCAGSLVSSDVVLTVAHCQTLFRKGIRIGVTNINFGNNGYHRSVVGRLVHSDYNRKTGANDIMLLKLNEPIPDDIKPVEFARSKKDPKTAHPLTIMGYGKIVNKGFGMSPHLETEEVYTEYAPNCEKLCDMDSDQSFCSTEMKSQFFYQNSGGPILDENDVQVGLKAWGGSCGVVPNIYERIGAFGDWIEQGICYLSSDKPKYCSSGGRPFSCPPDGNICQDSVDCGGFDLATQCMAKCDVCNLSQEALSDECAEDKEGKVDMGGALGEKDCAWLDRILSLTHHIRYVCDRTDVAFHCPKTCKTCDHLKPTETR